MSTTRLIAIGDIHGQISPLRTLIDQIELLNLTSEDILIFLGDYIDRGEDSRAVIELLLEIKARRPNSVFLRGNHEQLLISAMDAEKPEITEFDTLLNGPEMNLWLQNGGIDTLYNYELNNVLEIWSHFPKTHEEFIRATTFEFRKNGYYFVHAGILSFGQWWEGASYNIDPRLWIREPFLSSDEDFVMSGPEAIGGKNPVKYASAELGRKIVEKMGQLIGAKAREALSEVAGPR